MKNGRCRMHGGKSTGPRTPEGLDRSRRANWKHGRRSAEAIAESAGIRVPRDVILAFVLSGLAAGLAGWLLSSRTAGATANLGIGMLFQAFAAVVICGVSLKGGVGRLSGVFAGVLLLSSIQSAINVMGMPPHYTMMIQGGLVLAAVLLDTAKNGIRRRYL